MTSPSKKKEPESGPTRDEGYAGALHEVSNALTVALGWLQIAQRGGESVDFEKALKIVEEHTRRGHQIARRAIGADVELTEQKSRASELVKFAVESLQPQAHAKQVKIELESTVESDTVIDGAPTLTQVLTNLLLNALSFSPAQSIIKLKLRHQGDALCFSISDQGPGIARERLPHLFTDPHSTRVGGAGIGLPHSRVLARRHGGDLRVVPSNQGARFEVIWPLLTKTKRTESSSRRRVQLTGARVLVVDDDEALATLVELGLESRGAEVIVASSQEQLRLILEGRPVLDAVLLDLSPVESNLQEVLDELKNKLPQNCALILMSGQPDGVPQTAGDCFCDWIRKPFEVGELVQSLAQHLQAE